MKRINTRKIDILENLKAELYELRKRKVKGAVIRSRAINILNDEKPSKLFSSFESHNFTSKIIPKLVKENGNTQQNQILQETEQYYRNLYSSKEGEITDIDLNKLLNNYNIPKLKQNESNNLEGLLTL